MFWFKIITNFQKSISRGAFIGGTHKIWTPNLDPQSGPQYGPPYGPHYGPPSNGVNSFECSSVNIRIDFENMEHLDNTWFHALLRPTLPARLFQ